MCSRKRRRQAPRHHRQRKNDGDEIYLCPGKVSFSDEIVLPTSKSITIACAGPKGSCIFDGNAVTRHFRSDTSGLTFNFVALIFINGLAGDDSPPFGPEGGSLFDRIKKHIRQLLVLQQSSSRNGP